MKPACQSWKPNILTLYRLSCQNAFCQNSVWNVFKGNQLDKCQEKANLTAGFSSTCGSCPTIPDGFSSNPAQGCYLSFSSYSLSPSCPSIFKLLLAVVESFHTLLRGQLPTASPSFSGDPLPCRTIHGEKEGGCRKGFSRWAHQIGMETSCPVEIWE